MAMSSFKRAITFLLRLAAILAFLPALTVRGAEHRVAGDAYRLPEIRYSAFGDDLGLMRIERGDMAEQLASYVTNELAKDVLTGNPEATALAEKLLGLALHLDPRNRTAVVTNFQLARGIMPDPVLADYKPATLSELFLKRSELLQKQGGEDNIYLSAVLLFSAVEINPRNAEAVYRYEMLRREKEIDWGRILRNGD